MKLNSIECNVMSVSIISKGPSRLTLFIILLSFEKKNCDSHNPSRNQRVCTESHIIIMNGIDKIVRKRQFPPPMQLILGFPNQNSQTQE